jgi:cytochrome c biogenesis protein CcdA
MIAGLIHLVIYLIILGVIIWLLLWLIDNVPLPEPFNRVARVVVIVIGVLVLILALLNFIEPGALGTLR